MAPTTTTTTQQATSLPEPSAKPTRSKRFRFKHPHATPKPLFTKPHTNSPYTTTPHITLPPSPPPLSLDADPEPSFASALFSSLTSSSAAQFWSDIYGQPIHIYPRPILSGQRQPLTDDEYVAYVQRRVWENTRQGVEERARERQREKEEMQAEQRAEQRAERHAERQAEKERERERKRKRDLELDEETSWQVQIREYVAAWRDEDSGTEIPWPPCGVAAAAAAAAAAERIEGIRFDVGSIREFLYREARVMGVGFGQVVKVERVRWHPDKILQRFGEGEDADREQRMRWVGEVWRAVDEVWRGIKE